MNEERLVQAVEHIDNDIVVCDGVDIRPRKLPIYQNTLTKNTNQTEHNGNSENLDNELLRVTLIHMRNIVKSYKKEKENLLGDAKRVDGTISDIPGEESVGILRRSNGENHQQNR